MFRKFLIMTMVMVSLVGLILSGTTVLAQSVGTDIAEQLGAAAGPQGAALGEPVDPRVTIILIIRVLLGLTAIVLISLNVYAGYLWMTAGGNEEQVTKAKTTIRNATIGLVIVLSSYSITIFAANLARGYSTGSKMGVLQGVLGSFLQSGK